MVVMAICTVVAAFVVFSPQKDVSSTELHNGILNMDEKQNCDFINFMVLMAICTVVTACVVIWSPKNHNGGSERTWTVKEDEAILKNHLQDLKTKSDRILALEHCFNLLQAEYELQSEFGRNVSLGAHYLRILALENKFNEILASETRDYRSFA